MWDVNIPKSNVPCGIPILSEYLLLQLEQYISGRMLQPSVDLPGRIFEGYFPNVDVYKMGEYI